MAFFDFLRADDPHSTTRVAITFTTVLFIPAFVYVWTALSLRLNVMQDVPAGVVWLMGTLLGAGLFKAGIEASEKIFGKKDEPK